MNKKTAQSWIFSPKVDLAFIIGPAFFVTAGVIVFQNQLEKLSAVPPWMWLLLIVGVDVTHVYSTLFRTYFDRVEMQQRQALYLLTPLIAWVVGCLLYSLGSMVFWRVLAYLAVFHFVRQQYGLMMIYARTDDPRYKLIDKMAIYAATLYPLIYWHGTDRSFEWFVQGDFYKFSSAIVVTVSAYLYLVILIAYALKELLIWRRNRAFNWPRNLMLIGTALSWIVGIVILNNDIAFSAVNVISHGVPYLALMWIYSHNQVRFQGAASSFQFAWLTRLFSGKWLVIYLLGLFIGAYFEETLWDGLIWHEHETVLYFADKLPQITSEQTLVWLVPLLAMPQITHYVLDAYIWRMQKSHTDWKNILFLQVRS
jgi:hypothetical protein